VLPLLLLALAARAPAPDFELRDSTGTVRRLADFRGKVVVLSFWTTWCAPCRAEVPVLAAVQREYSSRGFTVLAVAMDARGWPAVTPFLSEHKVNYPVLLGTPGVARLYGGLKTLPRTLFLDRRGRIVAAHGGLLGEVPLRRIVETLLSEAY